MSEEQDSPSAPSAEEAAELLDWKRRMFDLYRRVRESDDPRAAWEDWRRTRDELWATHPQSPVPEAKRASFEPLPYYDYDPEARVIAEVVPTEPEVFPMVSSGGGDPIDFSRNARASFRLFGEDARLDLFWLEGYGGGVFLAFRDATSGTETYGAGRYVLDTVKGADLGQEGGRLVLDFNFSYHPSCVYDPRWVCPLAPPENWLLFPIRAGERLP